MTEPIHYGPIYRRPSGVSMALCDPSILLPNTSRMLTKDRSMVDCEKCKMLLESAEKAVQP